MPERQSPFRRSRPRWNPATADQMQPRELPGLRLRLKGPFRSSVVAFIIAAVCLAGVYAWVFSTRDQAIENLALAIDRAAASGGEVALDLDARTTFDWDRVLVLPPYTSPEAATAVLGPLAGRAAEETGLAERDDVSVLAFVRGDELAAVIAFPRDRGDFSVVGRPQGFDRMAALFYVEPMPGQPDWLNVWPANP